MWRVACSAAASSVSAEATAATTSIGLDHGSPLEVAADVDGQLDAALDLDAGAADLAVAHGGVQVAGSEEPPGTETGK